MPSLPAPFRVRPAIAADAPALAALSIQVWLATYAAEGVNDLLARYVLEQFTPAAFKAWMDDAGSGLIVAEADGHLIGYARLGFDAPRPPPLSSAAGTELCTLYVLEPFTRSGVGSALLDEARAAARERTGSDAMWLTVNAGNHRARSFYGKHGFVRRGTAWFVLGEGRHENLVLARRP